MYNRLTEKIYLEQFTLAETKEFLISKNIDYSNYTIAELYMVFGGIPYYLELLKAGLSYSQNVDEIIFSKNALLKNEFNDLFSTIFLTIILIC
ncbi:MAG: hypothetical protein LBV58_03175 [Acholeplasmatales bacterium]|nr:hypothetical protein [Acholeplasmatales bacterium]